MKVFNSFLGLLALPLLVGCVPKTQYDDQQTKLIEAQNRLRSLQASTAECDKDLFLQLKEQAQSLDLLTQELVERNTELSKEVARLKVFESQVKAEDQDCGRKLANEQTDCEGKLERTRATYEDLVRQLRAEIARLKEASEKKAENGAKTKGKTKSTEASKPKK
jgi:uncharacterized small protein (DUF1192 family)